MAGIKKDEEAKWVLVEITVPDEPVGRYSVMCILTPDNGGLPKFREALRQAVWEEECRYKHWRSLKYEPGEFAVRLIVILDKNNFFPSLSCSNIQREIAKISKGESSAFDYLCRVVQSGEMEWWEKRTKGARAKFVPVMGAGVKEEEQW